MRLKQSAIGLAVMLSFAAGILVAPLLPHTMQSAHAAAAPMAPHVVDIAALQDAEIALRPNSQLRTMNLYSTPDGAVGVQAGIVPKHTHQQSDELQYIIEGSGSMWVGGERKEFKPGTLIVIPRGSAHGGATATYRALFIKLPLPVAGDTQLLD